MKIGFYDSGLGGQIILNAVRSILPEYDYQYYGDTLNLPLGDKTEPEILTSVKNGVEWLFNNDCVLVIVACNTASAESLRSIQNTIIKQTFTDHRVLGMIVPTAEVVTAVKSRHPLLIATKRTVDSGAYQREIEKLDPLAQLTSVAIPKLVPLIEQSNIDDALTLAKTAIDTVRAANREVDSVILGCTHYTLLKDSLPRAYQGVGLPIISQDEIIPAKLKAYLEAHSKIERKLTRGGTKKIFSTG